ncbi:MAG: glycosyltransferase [Actinomycetota bacterium]|nr:glycosyltransferase [Actinomycetota bacterium]
MLNGPNTQPTVSVVIPTRNRRELLARTLGTVLDQRDVDLEVVIVDDGSTDRTAAYLEGLSDERVRVLRHAVSRGVCQSRNVGLAAARGAWVAFTDDDDLWGPTRLAELLAATQANPDAGWACSGVISVNQRLEPVLGSHPPIPEDVVRRLLSFNCVPGGGSGVLARTDLVRLVGGFDVQLRNLADWDLWIRLALAAPLVTVPDPLLAYVRHDGNMSTDLRGIDEEWDRVTQKYEGARRRLGVEVDATRFLRWTAGGSLMSGDRRSTARKHLRIARREGDLKALARAAVVLAWPSLMVRRRARAREESLPPGWLADATTWLIPLRAASKLDPTQPSPSVLLKARREAD